MRETGGNPRRHEVTVQRPHWDLHLRPLDGPQERGEVLKKCKNQLFLSFLPRSYAVLTSNNFPLWALNRNTIVYEKGKNTASAVIERYQARSRPGGPPRFTFLSVKAAHKLFESFK